MKKISKNNHIKIVKMSPECIRGGETPIAALRETGQYFWPRLLNNFYMIVFRYRHFFILTLCHTS